MILQNLAVPRLSVCLLTLVCLSVVSSQAQTPSFSAKVVNQSLGSTTVSLTVGITNTSLFAARNVTITSVTPRVTLGAGPLALAATPLPLLLGNIGPSTSAVAGLTLNASPGVRRFSLVENGTAQDAAGEFYGDLNETVDIGAAPDATAAYSVGVAASTTSVPEPSSFGLFLIVSLAVGVFARPRLSSRRVYERGDATVDP